MNRTVTMVLHTAQTLQYDHAQVKIETKDWMTVGARQPSALTGTEPGIGLSPKADDGGSTSMPCTSSMREPQYSECSIRGMRYGERWKTS